MKRRRRTPRQRIEASLRNVVVGVSLKRCTSPDEMASDEMSMFENFGLECFRLGIEYEKERRELPSRNSQRPTMPAPAPEDDDDDRR